MSDTVLTSGDATIVWAEGAPDISQFAPIYTISSCPAEWLTLGDSKVRISLIDGRVELNGVDPDEAAKLFWAAITRNFPMPR